MNVGIICYLYKWDLYVHKIIGFPWERGGIRVSQLLKEGQRGRIDIESEAIQNAHAPTPFPQTNNYEHSRR